MAGFSDHLENALVEATLRGGSYTGGLVYVALFMADPTDAGTGAELNDAAYARQVAGNPASSGFGAPSNGSTSNSNAITFPAIAGTSKIVTHWGIYDAATLGNLLYHAPLESSKTLDTSDVLSFPIGSLTITLA